MITPEQSFDQLERILGYKFNYRKLLEDAVTHPSVISTKSSCCEYQRLEFLGDAVLDLISAETLYATHKTFDEGRLTIKRSTLINTKTLANTARRIKLGDWIRMGKSEIMSNGQDRDGALADTLEAIFGAIWLDGGLPAARELFEHLQIEDIGFAGDSDSEQNLNPKGRLQEYAQKIKSELPVYRVCHQSGPSHAPLYKVSVSIGATRNATGEGPTKRSAEANAAANLLKELNL